MKGTHRLSGAGLTALFLCAGCASPPVEGGWMLRGESEAPDEGRAAVTAIAVSPDGTEIAAGTYDGAVWVFPAADLEAPDTPVEEAPGDRIEALAWSPDGRVLHAVSRLGRVLRLDREHRRSHWQASPLGRCTAACVSSDGEVAAVHLPEQRLRSLAPGGALREVQVFKPTALAIDADSIYVGGGKRGEEYHLSCFDRDSLEVRWRVESPAEIRRLWVGPRAIVAGSDTTCLQFDPSGTLQRRAPLPAPIPVGALGEDLLVLSGEELWRWPPGAAVPRLEARLHRGETRAAHLLLRAAEPAEIVSGGSRGDVRRWVRIEEESP